MKQRHLPTVTTIVLSWNSADFIAECLDSLLNSKYKTKILVIDNDSADNTREVVTTQFPSVELINSGANLGYAGGNNVGFRHLVHQKTDYVFVLNPDAGVEPECLENLIDRMEKEKNLAVVSPMIYYYGGKKIWYAGSTINWKTGATPHIGWSDTDKGQYKKQKYTERINGCAMLIRKAVLDEVGFLDENYFLYYEETDFSVRLNRAKYKLGFQPDAHVWHRASSSTGGYDSMTYQYYMTRNRLYFLHKFKPKGFSKFFIMNVLRTLRESVTVLHTKGWKIFVRVVKARYSGYSDYVKGNFGQRNS